MSWNSKVLFFQQEIERLSKQPFALDFQSFLEGFGLNGLPATDDAIRVYARTLEWPPLLEKVRFEICLRLSCAQWYCADMVGREDDEEVTGTEFLESLLIDYWRDVGRVDWMYATFVQGQDAD